MSPSSGGTHSGGQNVYIYWVQLSRFQLKMRTESSLRKAVFRKTGRWVVSRIVIVTLICRGHKPTDSINLLSS
jgi:hypothetical protein